MGLFLQKTNIIRDYLEDIVEEPAPRMFWPREIWGKHAKQLADFKVGSRKQMFKTSIWSRRVRFSGRQQGTKGRCSAARPPALACLGVRVAVSSTSVRCSC